MTRILLISSLFLLLISCNNDDDTSNDNCITFQRAFITEVNAPMTGVLNQPIDIEVIFQVNDGCGGFNKFIETAFGIIKIIEVDAKYEGCFCTLAIETIIENYTFTPTSTGIYPFHFKSPNGEIIAVFIEVN